jgi:hypothetical protein
MGITVDITKAKDVWKNKIRKAREIALAKLDIDYMKALEQNENTTTIIANKNTLRDLPSQVDSTTTVDEIKGVWNDMLGDK